LYSILWQILFREIFLTPRFSHFIIVMGVYINLNVTDKIILILYTST